MTLMRVVVAFPCFALVFSPPSAVAGEAHVVRVVHERLNDTHSFSVTVQHGDEGWDHYADRFEIVNADGTVIAIRELAHPHIEEQPFTRTLGRVHLPRGTGEVTVRARDSVHGHGGQELLVSTRKAYSCGAPKGAGITPPRPETSTGRVRCPAYPPARSKGAEAPG